MSTQVKTLQKSRFGQTLSLPVVGEVSISDEGVLEIEDHAQAVELVNCNIGFFFEKQGQDANGGQVEEIQTKAEPAETLEADPGVKEEELQSQEGDQSSLGGEPGEDLSEATTEEDLADKAEEAAANEEDTIKATIEAMDIDQMKAFAAEHGLPKSKWQNMGEAKLRAYLIETVLQK